MTDFLPLPPPPPPTPPPAPKKAWMMPALVVGVVLTLLLVGGIIIAVVQSRGDDAKPTPRSGSFAASAAVSTSTVEPTVLPSPSPSTLPPITPQEALALIQDTFAAYAEYSLEDGFLIPLDPKFVIVNVGEVATCGAFTIDGSEQFSYPTFWCSTNDTLYSSISSFRLIDSQGFLTREAFLLNGWAVALTDAQSKTTLEYVACALGTIARSDVDFEQITDPQAAAIREYFFPTDTDPSRNGAFIIGYAGRTKISCDVFS